jgi:hypothetical protein
MKKHKLSTVTLSLLLLLGASSAEAKPPQMVSATPVIILMPIVLNNPDFFDFSNEQKKHIAQIANQTNQVREELDQAILDMRHELREELSKYHPDTKIIDYLSKEIPLQESRRLQLSLDCANGLRQIMKAEQWKTLIELME